MTVLPLFPDTRATCSQRSIIFFISYLSHSKIRAPLSLSITDHTVSLLFILVCSNIIVWNMLLSF